MCTVHAFIFAMLSGGAYCAEQFENDGSPVSTIVKGVKRAMAGEYTFAYDSRSISSTCTES